uniref:Cyclin I n=1 Tax=Sinocyclocheilus anshuiensis TaxID=1608454 RepID=A0A671PBQ9_9TELE
MHYYYKSISVHLKRDLIWLVWVMSDWINAYADLCVVYLIHCIFLLQDTDISPEKRDEAVRWLRDVHSQLKLYPETLCLAIGILDRFLSAIKARPKYLRCIAISCFFLAVKTSEEDEVNISHRGSLWLFLCSISNIFSVISSKQCTSTLVIAVIFFLWETVTLDGTSLMSQHCKVDNSCFSPASVCLEILLTI